MALNGKVAVVTGAAQGIGRAFTEVLLENGAKVALLDINTDVGKSLKESLDKQYGQGRTIFLSCDVESDEQFKACFQTVVEKFGRVDIMCNNAGILNEVMLEKTISINLTSVIKATYVALDHMNKLTGGRGGVIVNTASMAGVGPLLSGPVYTATKHGVVGFTRAMAAASDVSGYGIRLNAICPGFVKTDLFLSLLKREDRYAHLSEVTHKLVDKFGMTEMSTVQKALLELLTDETKNGQAIMALNDGISYCPFVTIMT